MAERLLTERVDRRDVPVAYTEQQRPMVTRQTFLQCFDVYNLSWLMQQPRQLNEQTAVGPVHVVYAF